MTSLLLLGLALLAFWAALYAAVFATAGYAVVFTLICLCSAAQFLVDATAELGE